VNENVGTTPVYSMGVAERLTGLTGRQIRYWELNTLLMPARTKGGQRMYSEADILKLKEIKRLMGEGLTLDRVKAFYVARDAKRLRISADAGPSRLTERTQRVGSLYTGGGRAELERFLDRKTGK
jgi:MerR family glutamine synthetase transcriptional repressor